MATLSCCEINRADITKNLDLALYRAKHPARFYGKTYAAPGYGPSSCKDVPVLFIGINGPSVYTPTVAFSYAVAPTKEKFLDTVAKLHPNSMSLAMGKAGISLADSKCILHTISTTRSSSGSPIVNEEGEIIGKLVAKPLPL